MSRERGVKGVVRRGGLALAMAAALGGQAPQAAALPLVGAGDQTEANACAAERAPILARKKQYDALHRSQIAAALGEGVKKGALFFAGAMLGQLPFGGGGNGSSGGSGISFGGLLSTDALNKAAGLQIPGVTLAANGSPLASGGGDTRAIAAMAVVVAIAGTVEAYVRLKAAEANGDRLRMAQSIDEDAGRQVDVARTIDSEEQALVACRQRQAADLSQHLAGASNESDRRKLTHERAGLESAIKQDVDLTGGLVGQQTTLAKTYTQGRAMTENRSEADVLAGQAPAYADQASTTKLQLPASAVGGGTLTLASATSTASASTSPPPASYVASRATEVRAAAGPRAKALKTLQAGATVQPMTDPAGGAWAQVDMGGGSKGYVRVADLIRVKAPELAAPSNIREHNRAVIAARDDGPVRLKTLLTEVQAHRAPHTLLAMLVGHRAA